jgi:hypothetical protein
MMTDWIFDAPAGLKDFREPINWHTAMQREARDIITILVGLTLGKSPEAVTEEDIVNEQEKLSYVDPTVTAIPSTAGMDSPVLSNGALRGRSTQRQKEMRRETTAQLSILVMKISEPVRLSIVTIRYYTCLCAIDKTST